jgi:hypothetical protein
MNMPTITKPATLRLKWYRKPQKPCDWLSPLISWVTRLRTSIPPMKKQMATDSPVMARL